MLHKGGLDAQSVALGDGGRRSGRAGGDDRASADLGVGRETGEGEDALGDDPHARNGRSRGRRLLHGDPGGEALPPQADAQVRGPGRVRHDPAGRLRRGGVQPDGLRLRAHGALAGHQRGPGLRAVQLAGVRDVPPEREHPQLRRPERPHHRGDPRRALVAVGPGPLPPHERQRRELQLHDRAVHLEPEHGPAVLHYERAVRGDTPGVPNRTLLVSKAGLNLYDDVLFTTRDEIRKHPDVVPAVVKAVTAGWTAYWKHPAPTNRLLPSYGDTESPAQMVYVDRVLKAIRTIPVGYSAPARMHQAADQMLQIKAISPAVARDWKASFTNAFLPKS